MRPARRLLFLALAILLLITLTTAQDFPAGIKQGPGASQNEGDKEPVKAALAKAAKPPPVNQKAAADAAQGNSRVLNAKENKAFDAQEADIIQKQHDAVEEMEAAQAVYADPDTDDLLDAIHADDLSSSISFFELHYPRLPGILAAFNALSYITLLMLTSKSHQHLIELIQLVAFACFPTLPLVQFFNNAWKTTYNMATGTASGFLYAIAGITGTYVFPRHESFLRGAPRHRVNDLPSPALRVDHGEPGGAFILTLFWLILQLGAAALGLAVNLDSPRRAAWDTAAIAADQRRTWTALSGSLAAVLALLAHLCVMQWTRAPRAPDDGEKDKARALPLMWEADVFMEVVLAALLQDLAVAYVGGRNSLLGLLGGFMANRVVLILVFLAVMVFYRRLRTLADEASGPKRRYRTLRPLFIGFSIAVCGAIVVLQVMSAVGEQVSVKDLQRMVRQRQE